MRQRSLVVRSFNDYLKKCFRTPLRASFHFPAVENALSKLSYNIIPHITKNKYPEKFLKANELCGIVAMI